MKKITAATKLITSSSARVGLSLPIDGSKDAYIRIQAGEHILFPEIKLPPEENKIDAKAVDFFNPNVEKTEILSFTGRRRTGPLSLAAQNARKMVFADPSPTSIDNLAWERFEDSYRCIETELSDLEDAILRSKGKFFGEETSFDEWSLDEDRLSDLIEDATEQLESLYELIKETRLTYSKLEPYVRFTLVSTILLFADPIPNGIAGLDHRLRYMLDRY